MKGDFTRSTFRPQNHFHGLLQQQGRVQMDADWNEQIDIQNYRTETGTTDLVGPAGGPLPEPGFGLLVGPGATALRLGRGHYYVEGLLCENEQELALKDQPHLAPESRMIQLADTSTIPYTDTPPPGSYLAYLDVFLHHLTALEKPEMREVSLGGPDHATREQTLWQVKLFQVAPTTTCLSPIADWETLTHPDLGQLTARTRPGRESTDPCIVNPGAGYRRLENQLYRVEVHQGGFFNGTNLPGNPTFKWSRDNGSITARWEGQNGNDLVVSHPGRDKVSGFATGQWLELLDEGREQMQEPGPLVLITSVKGNVITIDPGGQVVQLADFIRHPKIRRWDSAGAQSLQINAAAGSEGFLALEGGIEVRFGTGDYRSGDYWLIPARTSGPGTIGDIEWPRDIAQVPLPAAPHGVKHHYARLAMLQFDGVAWTLAGDCRGVFAPLTEQISLFSLGGDGQEAWANSQPAPASAFLPLQGPLRVGVARGRFPVVGARVIWTPASGQVNQASGPQEVRTNAQGISSVEWELEPDPNKPAQELTAQLVDAAGTPLHLPMVFGASLNMARIVAFEGAQTQKLQGARTVQRALEILDQLGGGQGGVSCCFTVGGGGDFPSLLEALKRFQVVLQEAGGVADKSPRWCFCLLSGVHDLRGGMEVKVEKPGRGALALVGHGLGATIMVEGGTLSVDGLDAFSLEEVEIRAANTPVALSVQRCSWVRIANNRMLHAGRVPAAGTVMLAQVDQALVTGNQIQVVEPVNPDVVRMIVDLFANESGLARVVRDLFLAPTASDARQRAASLQGLNADQRVLVSRGIARLVGQGAIRFSAAEIKSLASLAEAIGTPREREERLLAGLIVELNRVKSRTMNSACLQIGDAEGEITIERNSLMGTLSVYGEPSTVLPSQEYLKGVLNELTHKPGFFDSSTRGVLRVQNNRLEKMAVSLPVARSAMLDNPRGFFHWVHLLHNVFALGGSVVVGDQLCLHGNSFEVSEPGQGVLLGQCVGNVGTYLGNLSDGPLAALAAGLVPSLRVTHFNFLDGGQLNVKIVPAP